MAVFQYSLLFIFTVIYGIVHQNGIACAAYNKCQNITIPLCNDIAYNMTIIPNLFNHQTQDEASMEINQFLPLVKVRCSADLKFFLCTMYAPICTVLDSPIPPCRHLCQSARNGCESLMKKIGFQWPDSLSCDKFPEIETGLCISSDIKNTTEHNAISPRKVAMYNSQLRQSVSGTGTGKVGNRRCRHRRCCRRYGKNRRQQ